MEPGALFDAETVLTFPAENLEEADDFFDKLCDVLEEYGVEVYCHRIEESVSFEYE